MTIPMVRFRRWNHGFRMRTQTLLFAAIFLTGLWAGPTLAQDIETKPQQDTSLNADKKLREIYDWYRIGELNSIYLSWFYHSQHADSLKEHYKEWHDLLMKVGVSHDIVELLDERASRVLELPWKQKPDYKSWTKDEKGDWNPSERHVSAPTNYLKEIHQEAVKRGGTALFFSDLGEAAFKLGWIIPEQAEKDSDYKKRVEGEAGMELSGYNLDFRSAASSVRDLTQEENQKIYESLTPAVQDAMRVITETNDKAASWDVKNDPNTPTEAQLEPAVEAARNIQQAAKNKKLVKEPEPAAAK